MLRPFLVLHASLLYLPRAGVADGEQTMEQPSEEDHERGYSRENGSVPDGVLMSYDDSSHETYGDGS